MSSDNTMRRIFIGLEGDPDTGEGCQGVTVQADGECIFDLELYSPGERGQVKEGFREKLEDAFAEIWGDRPRVLFDTEVTSRRPTKPTILKEIPVWLVVTNEDLTEGKGRSRIKHVCESKATAQRLAKGAYVQGSDCPIQQARAVTVQWRDENGKPTTTTLAPTHIELMSPDDRDHQRRLDEEQAQQQKREQALIRAKALGLSKEEIDLLANPA